MVRAILKNGVIHPIDPLPADWREGQELEVELSEDEPIDVEAIEQWGREVDEAAAAISDEDHKTVQQAIDAHEREQKELMARRMGLR